jgi:hypothetical protein
MNVSTEIPAISREIIPNIGGCDFIRAQANDDSLALPGAILNKNPPFRERVRFVARRRYLLNSNLPNSTHTPFRMMK